MNREDLLFKMFPPSFRQRYGHEMWRVYQESYRDILQEKGRFAAFRYAISSSFDFLKVALHEQLSEVQMMKSRPQVLLSLLALAGVTVFSSVQYGLWNVRAGNENAGFLSVLNREEHKQDVTDKPDYAHLVAVLNKQFPGSKVRLMDHKVQFAEMKGTVRALSVMVLWPALDERIDPKMSIHGTSKPDAKQILKTLATTEKKFNQETAPVLQQMNFADFDVQHLCLTSHPKIFPMPLEHPDRKRRAEPEAIYRYSGSAALVKNPETGKTERTVFPYFHNTSTSPHLSISALLALESKGDGLEHCEFRPPQSRDELTTLL